MTALPWRAQDWRGRPWEETVLIETHAGTFTQDGTYRDMIEKLDHLVKTGITRRSPCRWRISQATAAGVMTACSGTRPTAPRMGGLRI